MGWIFTAEKNAMRSAVLLARKHFDPVQKALCERIISESFINSEFYKNAETLLCYVSTETEVSTADILRSCLAAGSGKTLAVPRVSGSEMSFFEIRSEDDLAPCAFGINEPKEHCAPCKSFENTVCITPGLIFTENGYRIGYGKGYYDRFFAAHPEIAKIGLIFEKFLYSENTFTPDSFDIPTDIIITERRIIDVRKRT
ncbi:MAG: 5-formyltetrahydrofolate cyclo-ligase [Ruminococcus sp.]|jgi:5-formyltetrahydrofolate cyclo-ligase|nr:5-formyltetrahydrofolate cyclo-ligase [Ruminococcus sp.]